MILMKQIYRWLHPDITLIRVDQKYLMSISEKYADLKVGQKKNLDPVVHLVYVFISHGFFLQLFYVCFKNLQP